MKFPLPFRSDVKVVHVYRRPTVGTERKYASLFWLCLSPELPEDMRTEKLCKF